MSIDITFPDGAIKQFDAPITGMQIADSISSGLRRNAVAITVNDEQWDLSREINDNASVAIITRDTDEGLEVLRHDAAHIMAEAVKELYPETQVTMDEVDVAAREDGEHAGGVLPEQVAVAALERRARYDNA